MDYTFGFFERFTLFVVLLMMWAMITTLGIAVVAEHGSKLAEFTHAVEIGSIAIVALLIVGLFGRPLVSGLPQAYRSAKEVLT